MRTDDQRPGRRRGRAGRIVLRIVLSGLALAVAVVAAALVALHTDWGREQLRVRVQAALNETFVGDVSVGRLEGSVFGELIVRDLRIEDADGRPAIRAAELRLELALWPLLHRQAHLEQVSVAGLVVDARRRADGTLSLAGLLVKKDEKSPWDVRLDALAIAGAQVAIETPEETVHLDDVGVAASATIVAGGPLAARAEVHARWRERELDLAAAASVAVADGVITIGRADVSAAGLELHARDVRLGGGQTAGELVLDAPARAVSSMLPTSPLLADVRLELSARPGDAKGRVGATQVTVKGTIGASPVDGVLTIEPLTPRVHGTLRARDLDARAILRDAVPSAMDLTLALDLALHGDAGTGKREPGLAALRGHVQLTGGGRVAGQSARDLDVRVDLDHGRAAVKASGRGDGGARFALDAALAFQGGGLDVERAHLVARADDLDATAGAVAPVRGSLDAELTASGRVSARGTDLVVRGHVNGRSLAYGTRGARSLRIDVDAAGLPTRPRGRVHAELRGIVDRGRPLGRLSLDARSRTPGTIDVVARSQPSDGAWVVDVAATVRVAPEVTAVTLGKHRLRSGGVDWHGSGGVIEIRRDVLKVRGLRTTIAGAALAADATYHHAGRHRGDLVAAVQLDGVDLAEVDRSFRIGELLADHRLALRGVVDGRAEVARRAGRFSGSVAGSARGVRVRAGATPIQASLEASLALDGVLLLEADVRGPDVGAVTVSLDLAAPRDLGDPRAWQRLERAAIRRGELAIEGLDLAAAARLAGVDPARVTGRVDGKLTLTAVDTTGWLRGRDLALPRSPTPLDADLTVQRVEAGVAAITLVATLRGVTRGRAEAIVRVPQRPFDLMAWARIDAQAVRGATVHVDELVLDAKTSRRLGLREPWQGRASLVIEVDAGLRSATATAEVRGLRGGRLARPADVRAEVTIDAAGVVAKVRAAVEGRWLLAAEARVPIAIEDVQARGLPALLAAPLAATLRIDQAPLQALRRTVGVDMALGGTLTASATLRGTVGAPVGDAELVVAGVAVDARHPVLRELRITAAYDGKLLRAEARGQQSDGGTLHLTGHVDPRAPAGARGTLAAARFDLAPLVHLAPHRLLGVGGVLDADVRVQGADPATATITGMVRVRQGQVPIGGSVGTLRHARVDITLQDGTVRVSVDGRIGTGKLVLRSRGELDGLVLRTAEADITVADVTLISELEPRLAGRINVRLRKQDDVWRVKAVVRDGRVEVPEGTAKDLHEPDLPDDLVFVDNQRPARSKSRGRVRIGERPDTPWLIAEIELRSTTVSSSELRGTLRGALTVTLGEGALAIDGGIDAASGTVDLFDRRYRVERAAVRFDGSPDPVLNVRLVYDFPDLTLYANVRGRLSKPELELASEPGTYSEAQLLSFLLGGEPGAEPGSETRDAAASVASSLLSQKVSGYLDYFLPIDLDVLRYEASTVAEGAAVTIGKWVTRKLFVAYRRRLESRPDENTSEAQIEYWLGRNLLFDATVGDRGVHGLDLLWLRRW